MTERTEMAQRARQAAEYVEAGWTKYTLEDARGRVCALGALNKSFTGDAQIDPRGVLTVHSYITLRDLTVKELKGRWWRRLFHGSGGLISINDRSRSGKRIARAFRRVAMKLDPYCAIPLKAPVTQRDMELAGGPES
jgi:hypothetical protein